MDNSVVYISHNCVLFSYSQGRAESRDTCSFKREATGAELTFHHSTLS